MMLLKKPDVTYQLAIDKCKEGITGNPTLLKNLNDAQQSLINLEQKYESLAISGKLCELDTSKKDKADIIIGNLSKEDLIKIYDDYFVGKSKPSRYIYDKILASTDECPFCGGIETPRNLDHFVPKHGAPEFSILPLNLIPSCRNCNMDGKGSDFPDLKEKQIIHPYLDKNIFFTHQWIHARYIQNQDEPNHIEYYVNPPQDWSDTDKSRVTQHFQDFDIANRYSKVTASELPNIEAQIIEATKNGFTKADIKNVIVNPVINSTPFLNHWKRVMYLALLDTL